MNDKEIDYNDIVSEKVGEFEWITSSLELKSHLSRLPSNLSRGLVVGCGTSDFSISLLDNYCKEIDSLDNDLGVIHHMIQRYNDDRLKWLHYDLVTNEGNDAQYLSEQSNQYDAIFDKGTFDAILVGGETSSMIIEIIRLLTPYRGIYFLCSIFPCEVLEQLFTSPLLGLDCTFHPLSSSSSASTGTVMIATKTLSAEHVICLASLRVAEKAVMDEYYRAQAPLLTPEIEGQIRVALQASPKYINQESSFTAEEVYTLVIEPVFPHLGYTHELFMADLDGRVSFTEEALLEFIKEKQ